MARFMSFSFMVILAAVVCGCTCSPSPGQKPPELVMADGSEIRASFEDRSITIVAGPGYTRKYRWDNCELVAHPCPRSERWLGELGILDEAWGILYWHSCEGISRPVVSEAQMHFANQQTADLWLTKFCSKLRKATVYTNDGLLIQSLIVPDRQQLSVRVLQVCISGSRPQQLRGAVDTAVVSVGRNNIGDGRVPCVKPSEKDLADTLKAWEWFWGPMNEWGSNWPPASFHLEDGAPSNTPLNPPVAKNAPAG